MSEYVPNSGVILTAYVQEADCQILEETLEIGIPYLFRARVCDITSSAFANYLMEPLLNGSWAWPAQDLDWDNPILAEDVEEIARLNQDYFSVSVHTTTDMATTPYMTDRFALLSGRFLTEEDYRTKAPVCIIKQDLASIRGIGLEDILRIELRDYETDAVCTGNDWVTPRKDDFGNSYSWRDARRQTLELTIVGIVSERNYDFFNDPSSVIIPDSLISSEWSSPYYNSLCSFVLNKAEDQALILADPNIEALINTYETWGEPPYKLGFLENGWDAFHEAAAPMELSSQFSTVLFGIVGAVLLALAMLLYILQRYRELGIQRALGVPEKSAAAQALLPFGILSGLGVLTGAILAFQTGSRSAADTLASLEAEIPLSVSIRPADIAWMAVPMYLITLLAVWLILRLLSRRPVLSLLQRGRAAKREQAAAPTSAPLPPVSAPSSTSASTAPVLRTAPSGSGSPGAVVFWRHLFRHIRRTPGRALLAALAAALFTAGLTYLRWSIQNNESRIDALYDTIEISGSIQRV